MIGKGQRGKKGQGQGAPRWLLPPALPLTPSVLLPHTHPEEHSDDGAYGSFSHHGSSSHLVSVCPTCVRTRVRGPLCGRWVRMCPCVSLCQRPRKGRPKGVVFHFYSFINSPLRSDCVCQIGQNGRRDKAASGAMGWPLNSPEFFLLWIIMFVIICFISLFNIQAMHHI